MGIGAAYPNSSQVSADNCRIGFLDYNDTATAITPLVIVSGVPQAIPNNGLGVQTIKAYPPVGVTDVWDAIGGTFDWSQLKLGDMVDIRVDLKAVTTSVNTQVTVELELGTGGSIYTIPFITDEVFKAAGNHFMNRYNGIYMGDLNTLNNGGVFKITTDANCTLVVNGWYCKILARG